MLTKSRLMIKVLSGGGKSAKSGIKVIDKRVKTG